MITIKNSKELKKLVNENKDLIYPNEDIRIEYQTEKDEIRNVECRDLFLMNDDEKFDFNGNNFDGNNFDGFNFNGNNFNGFNFNGNNFNGNNFNGYDFNGKKVSYHAFFNCYGSIKCESIEGRRESHAEPVCLDGEIEIIKPEETKELDDEIIEVNGIKYKKIN